MTALGTSRTPSEPGARERPEPVRALVPAETGGVETEGDARRSVRHPRRGDLFVAERIRKDGLVAEAELETRPQEDHGDAFQHLPDLLDLALEAVDFLPELGRVERRRSAGRFRRTGFGLAGLGRAVVAVRVLPVLEGLDAPLELVDAVDGVVEARSPGRRGSCGHLGRLVARLDEVADAGPEGHRLLPEGLRLLLHLHVGDEDIALLRDLVAGLERVRLAARERGVGEEEHGGHEGLQETGHDRPPWPKPECIASVTSVALQWPGINRVFGGGKLWIPGRLESQDWRYFAFLTNDSE